MSEYNEDSIKILSAKEAGNLFTYQKVLELAAKYPCSPPAFIERLVLSCQFADFPLEQAVQRYLAKDYSVPVSIELVAVFKDHVAAQHLKSFGK